MTAAASAPAVVDPFDTLACLAEDWNVPVEQLEAIFEMGRQSVIAPAASAARQLVAAVSAEVAVAL